MSNALAVRTATAVTPAQFSDALIKAVGWDKVPAEQRQLALHICERYGLDPMLRHVVMIEGKPFVTRDALLHVAHRSGVFDGIEVTDPVLEDTHWRCRATVYRKDMSRPIDYPGRYPKAGGNARYAPEMAIKVAETMALRRAFAVSAPVLEEQWDLDEATTTPRSEPRSLGDKIAARREAIEARTTAARTTGQPEGSPQGGTSPSDHAPGPGGDDPADPGAPPHEPDLLPADGEGEAATSAPPTSPAPVCEAFHPQLGRCTREGGHPANHRNREGETWR